MEKIVAQVELDVAGDANDDPARQELEDALGERDADHQESVKAELAGRPATLFQVVQRHPDDLGRLHRDTIEQQYAHRTHQKPAAVFLQVWVEGTEALGQHRLGRCDSTSGGCSEL
jgi:hypothetical protein